MLIPSVGSFSRSISIVINQKPEIIYSPRNILKIAKKKFKITDDDNDKILMVQDHQ